MPQSFVKDHLHIVFSTKDRVPWLDDHEVRTEMFRYLGGICRAKDTPPIRVGGHHDHVHIPCSLGSETKVSELLRDLKSDSSRWIKRREPSLSKFRWQRGYAAFSISMGHIQSLIHYIESQAEHHKKVTFQEEYVRLLEKYNVEYDERYMWD